MKTFKLIVSVLSMLALIAGFLGAFIYSLSAQYGEAIIFLVMFIVGALCSMLSHDET
jgi:uncharacterized membrane protein